MDFMLAWESMSLDPTKICESSPTGRISNIFRLREHEMQSNLEHHA